MHSLVAMTAVAQTASEPDLLLLSGIANCVSLYSRSVFVEEDNTQTGDKFPDEV